MSGNISFLVVLTLFIMLKRSLGNTCAGYEVHYKDTSLNDMVLSGHSFKNFSGVHFGQCSRYCGETCRCRSFNFDFSGGSGYCELNDAEKEESPYDLRVKKGFIHVSFRPLTSVSSLYSLKQLFLSNEGPTLETLDFTIYISAVHRPFYISISISTPPKQHTTFI